MKHVKKYSFFNNIIKYVSNLLLFVFLIASLLLVFQNSTALSKKIDFNEFQPCNFNRYQFSSNENTQFYPEDIPIISETKNINCLSKAVRIELSNVDGSNNKIFIATNTLLYKLLNYSFNSFLIFLSLFYFPRLKQKILMLYFLINFTIQSVFYNSELLIKLLIPFSSSFSLDSNYLFNILFLFVYILKIGSKKLLLASMLITLFFLPDYIGLLVILFYFQKKGEIENFDKTEYKVLKFIPFAYYIIRYIASYINELNSYWQFSAMRIFQGESKFYDLNWTLNSLRCNADPMYFDNDSQNECRELSGGLLDNYLFITADPETTKYILIFVLYILLLFIYLQLLKEFPNNIFFITLLFVSPSFNFLTFQGNVDLIFLCLTFIVFKYFKNGIIYKGLILFLFALFNVHPLGGLIGLSIYSLKFKKIKSFIFTALLSTISVVSILWQLNNGGIGFMSGTIEASYGIQFFVYRFSDLNIYIGLILCLLILFILNYRKELDFNQIIDSKYYKNGYFDVIIYWFLFTSLFFNNAYRLPIFLVIFIVLNLSKDKRIRNFNIIFVFFAVTPFFTDFIFLPVFWIIKIASFIYIFSYLFSYLINDIKTIMFNTKLKDG